jgi:hypothetical protein
LTYAEFALWFGSLPLSIQHAVTTSAQAVVDDAIAFAHSGRRTLQAPSNCAHACRTRGGATVAHDTAYDTANGCAHCGPGYGALTDRHLVRDGLTFREIGLVPPHVDTLWVNDRAAVKRATT